MVTLNRLVIAILIFPALLALFLTCLSSSQAQTEDGCCQDRQSSARDKTMYTEAQINQLYQELFRAVEATRDDPRMREFYNFLKKSVRAPSLINGERYRFGSWQIQDKLTGELYMSFNIVKEGGRRTHGFWAEVTVEEGVYKLGPIFFVHFR